MAGKLSSLQGTKGVARYNHTDRPLHMGNTSHTGKGQMDVSAAPGFEQIKLAGSGPSKPNKAPGL